MGSAGTGRIEVAGDRDRFRVALAPGSYDVRTLTSGHTTLRLFDSSGTQLGSDLGTGASIISNVLVATGGTYYVEVSGYLTQTPSYTVRVDVHVPDDHGDNAAAATLLPLDQLTPGAIDPPTDRRALANGSSIDCDRVIQDESVPQHRVRDRACVLRGAAAHRYQHRKAGRGHELRVGRRRRQHGQTFTETGNGVGIGTALNGLGDDEGQAGGVL